MTYKECVEIRNRILSRIGTVITRNNNKYEILDIVFFPSKMVSIFLEEYKPTLDYDIAVSRFRTNNDLEIYYYCINLITRENAVLPLI